MIQYQFNKQLVPMMVIAVRHIKLELVIKKPIRPNRFKVINHRKKNEQ